MKRNELEEMLETLEEAETPGERREDRLREMLETLERVPPQGRTRAPEDPEEVDLREDLDEVDRQLFTN